MSRATGSRGESPPPVIAAARASRGRAHRPGAPAAAWPDTTGVGFSASADAGAERVASDPATGAVPAAGYFASLHYIGSLRGTYLLASDGAGLVVVDQHAAHERITFESLRLSWYERRYASQPLLVPRILSLDAVRAATLAGSLDVFERLGFEIEPFGDTDFALRAAPAMLRSAQHAAIIADALDDLGEGGQTARVDEAIDAVLVRMACHGSVRAGDSLNATQVHALFEQLDAVDFGANCPHGRPVYFKMDLAEIESRFGRR